MKDSDEEKEFVRRSGGVLALGRQSELSLLFVFIYLTLARSLTMAMAFASTATAAVLGPPPTSSPPPHAAFPSSPIAALAPPRLRLSTSLLVLYSFFAFVALLVGAF